MTPEVTDRVIGECVSHRSGDNYGVCALQRLSGGCGGNLIADAVANGLTQSEAVGVMDGWDGESYSKRHFEQSVDSGKEIWAGTDDEKFVADKAEYALGVELGRQAYFAVKARTENG